MYQSFNTELADKIGLKEAIVVQVLAHRIMQANHTGIPVHSLYCNEYWETAGITALSELFPYIQIGAFIRTINALISMNIIKCTFQPKSTDRRKWFTFTEYGWEMLRTFHVI